MREIDKAALKLMVNTFAKCLGTGITNNLVESYKLGFNAAMDEFKNQDFALQCEENRLEMEDWKERALKAEKNNICKECSEPF
jgi:hypothetical protein